MLPNLHDILPVGEACALRLLRQRLRLPQLAAPAGESISVLVLYTQSLPLQEWRFDDLINSSSNAASI